MTTVTKSDPRLMGIGAIARLGDRLIASNPHRRTLVAMTTGSANGVRVLGESETLDDEPGPVVAFGPSFWCLNSSGDLTEWTAEEIPVLLQTISVGASSAGWLVVCGDYLLVPIGLSGILVLDSTGEEVERVEGAMRRIQRMCASDDGTMLYLFDGAGQIRMLGIDTDGSISGIGLDVSVPDAVDVRGCVFDDDQIALVTGNRFIILDLTDPESPVVADSTVFSEQLRGICRLAAGSYFLCGRDRILAQDFRAPGSHSQALVAGVLQVTQPTTGRLTSETAARDSNGDAQDTDVVSADAWGAINRARFNGPVYCALVNSGRLFVGGEFTSVTTDAGTYARTACCAFDLSTGAIVSGWAPTVSGGGVVIHDIKYWNGIVLCGNFTSFGGSSRFHFAQCAWSNAAVTSFVADFNDTVYSLADDGTYLYAAGAFNLLNGNTHEYVSQFNEGNTNTSWGNSVPGTPFRITFGAGQSEPHVCGTNFLGTFLSSAFLSLETITATLPRALTTISGAVHIGCRLSVIDSTNLRSGCAATTYAGAVQAFNPILDRPFAEHSRPIGDILASGSDILVAGDFMSVDGTMRPYVCAVDSSGDLLPWDAALAPNGTLSHVNALAVSSGYVIMVGKFTNPVGGTNIYAKEVP